MYICKFVSSLLFKLNVTFTKTTTIIYNNLQHCNALMNAASMYSYSQKYFAFLKYINYFLKYILINITRGTHK